MDEVEKDGGGLVVAVARGRALVRLLGPLLGLIFVWVLFAVIAGDPGIDGSWPFLHLDWHNDFVNGPIQRQILLQSVVVGTAAVGATLIIISGGIDLSVGSTIALTTVVIALLMNQGASPGAAAMGGIGTGMLCGLAIGAMVIGHPGRVAALIAAGVCIYFGWPALGPWAIGLGAVVGVGVLLVNERFIGRIELSPFIVTLGMLGALRGLAKGLGDNQPVYTDRPSWLGDLMRIGEGGTLRSLPPGVWVMLGLALLAGLAVRYTRLGRHVFAIGSSEETARLCGVRIGVTKLIIYALAVGCAGLAGVLEFSFLGSIGDPTTAPGYELKVIAAVVIGGASLSGGQGSIAGTLIGVLIMNVVDVGCTTIGLDP